MAQPQNLCRLLIKSGWTALDARTDARAYADSAGRRYGTLERGGVRLAVTIDEMLAVDQRGDVIIYASHDSGDVILRALIVDPEMRRKGLARKAMDDVVLLATKAKSTVYIEPAPIDDKPVKKADLVKFYAGFGFAFAGARERVMVLAPQAKKSAS